MLARMNTANDPHGLRRFVEAQNPIYEGVLAELGAGCKTSHWMWFVFPQLKALGHSPTARRFGIASRDEASAYWRHRLLGARLEECTALVCAIDGKSAHDIFHSPDDLKFRSCMTLFSQVAPGQPLFARALERYYGGEPDARTIELLQDA